MDSDDLKTWLNVPSEETSLHDEVGMKDASEVTPESKARRSMTAAVYIGWRTYAVYTNPLRVLNQCISSIEFMVIKEKIVCR